MPCSCAPDIRSGKPLPAAGYEAMKYRWQDDAACKGQTSIFYPDVDEKRNRLTGAPYREPRAVCAECPVIGACFDAMLTTEPPRQRFGFLAGLTPNQRYERFDRMERAS